MAALKEVTATGHEVIFASARAIRDMLPVIASDFHHYSMIGGNGSLISVNGKVIQSTAFSEDETTKSSNRFMNIKRPI